MNEIKTILEIDNDVEIVIVDYIPIVICPICGENAYEDLTPKIYNCGAHVVENGNSDILIVYTVRKPQQLKIPTKIKPTAKTLKGRGSWNPENIGNYADQVFMLNFPTTWEIMKEINYDENDALNGLYAIRLSELIGEYKITPKLIQKLYKNG